jgi:hypothetical protein
MNIMGLDINVGNDTMLEAGIVIALLIVMGGLYVIFTVNAKHPLINFRVNENGAWKPGKYRLTGNLIVKNDIMMLLLNQAIPLGENYSAYTSENVVNGNKIEKVYLADLVGGLLVPTTKTMTIKEAVAVDTTNRGYIREMRNTRELTENSDPLRSELVKILPIAALIFIQGLVSIAMFNTANDQAIKIGATQ